jgi:hypothetical protein
MLDTYERPYPKLRVIIHFSSDRVLVALTPSYTLAAWCYAGTARTMEVPCLSPMINRLGCGENCGGIRGPTSPESLPELTTETSS